MAGTLRCPRAPDRASAHLPNPDLLSRPLRRPGPVPEVENLGVAPRILSASKPGALCPPCLLPMLALRQRPDASPVTRARRPSAVTP